MSIKLDFKRVFAFLCDFHFGSAYGLFPPEYKLESGTVIKQNPGQKKLWVFWEKAKLICDEWKVDTVAFLGDLVQGVHKKGFGAGNILVELDDQADCAEEVLHPVCKGRKVVGVSGTEYHDAKLLRIEKRIIENLGGQYCGYIINGVIEGTKRRFNLAHGSSQSMIYRETVAAREVLFFREAEALGKLPHFDLVARGHNHIYRHLDLPKCHYVLCPCWQAIRPDPYTLKNYAKMLPDIGFVIVAIDKDDRQHVVHWLMPEPVRISDFMRSI
jgi:hypothetical protein